MVPRSAVKVSKTKNSSLVTKCELGDSLVSRFILFIIKLFEVGWKFINFFFFLVLGDCRKNF